MKKLLLFLLAVTSPSTVLAQHENDNWIWDGSQGVTFVSGSPFYLDSVSNHRDLSASCDATISDKLTGKLILSSNTG